jgi:competence ComEA-like helix-hairpin-helix protein
VINITAKIFEKEGLFLGMANGYFERGEIYKVRMDYGVGAEEGAFRPGVIISSDRVNNTSGIILIAYMSRKAAGRPRAEFDVEVMATGIPSYVLCNQIAGVDKSRLMGIMGKLDYGEQKRVDDVLENVFDLGYVDDALIKEKDREISDRDALIAEKDKEIAELKARVAAEVAKTENLELSYKVEMAMWQKLYEKALNQVVDMKYTNDLFLKNHLGREETPKAPPVVVNDPPKTPEKKIELNSCTLTDLRQCGCTEAQARLIKSHGVYSSVEDLLRVDGVTIALFDTLKDKLYCDPPAEPPVEDTRLDINSCTITALKNVGFSLAVARQITTRRPYKSVADLKSVPGLKASLFRVMEPKLCCVPMEKEPEEKPPVVCEPDPGYEVDPPVIPENEEPEQKPQTENLEGKVNVNTVVSARQLTILTGMAGRSSNAIIRYRNEHGPFACLDDLLNVPEFGKVCMKRYRDKLTV